MIHQLSSYDPILEIRTIPKFRILNPLRPPGASQALVLLPYAGRPSTVRHGEEVPHSRLSTYQYSYLVDLTEYRLSFTAPLTSADANFSFHAGVALNCRVGEPALVVTRGIRDVGAALFDPVRHELRRIAARYDIAAFHQAEEAMNAVTSEYVSDAALRVRGIHVELLVDPEESLTSGRAFRDITRQARLDAMKRDTNLEMLRRDGAEGLLAEILEREGPTAALQWIRDFEKSERAELLGTLQALLAGDSDSREPFDLLAAQESVVERLTGGSNVVFGGTRGSRVRGLPGGTGSDRAPETPPRSSRVRGVPRSEEPDIEP